MNQIQQLTHVNEDQLEVLSGNLQMYILKSDKRAELLSKAIELNHKALNISNILITQKLKLAVSDIMNWINILHTYGVQYVDLLVDMRARLYQEEHAIQTLLQGYLPYLFV